MANVSAKVTVKIEVTIDELEVIVDALEVEHDTWREYIGQADEDPYDRFECEKTEALMTRLDKKLLQLKRGV